MLKKFAMYLFPSKEETGARMMAYGFLIVMPALGIAFAGWERIGYWIGLSGAGIAFAGLFMHFARNWEKIFPSDK